MNRNEWAYHNTLPVAVRRKGSDEFKVLFQIIHKDELEKNINRTDKEVEKMFDESDCLASFITEGFHYCDMAGTWLMDAFQARRMYRNTLVHAEFEYTNSCILVYFDNKWQMLKDVYGKLTPLKI